MSYSFMNRLVLPLWSPMYFAEEGGGGDADGEDSGSDGVATVVHEDVEYDVAELVKGQMLQSDYTRKTQELAKQTESIVARELKLKHAGDDEESNSSYTGDKDYDALNSKLDFVIQSQQDVQYTSQVKAAVQSDPVLAANMDKFAHLLESDESIRSVEHAHRIFKGMHMELYMEARDKVKAESAEQKSKKKAGATSEGAHSSSGKAAGGFRYDPSKSVGENLESYSNTS